MVFRDEWDRDPSVQMMRKVFSQMEKAQEGLLRDLKISPFDQRLRDGREYARDLFERLWPVGTRQGVVVGERDAALLYAHCLAHALNQRGVPSPSKVLEENGKIVRFFTENL
jgi:hypothetical protein